MGKISFSSYNLIIKGKPKESMSQEKTSRNWRDICCKSRIWWSRKRFKPIHYLNENEIPSFGGDFCCMPGCPPSNLALGITMAASIVPLSKFSTPSTASGVKISDVFMRQRCEQGLVKGGRDKSWPCGIPTKPEAWVTKTVRLVYFTPPLL